MGSRLKEQIGQVELADGVSFNRCEIRTEPGNASILAGISNAAKMAAFSGSSKLDHHFVKVHQPGFLPASHYFMHKVLFTLGFPMNFSARESAICGIRLTPL